MFPLIAALAAAVASPSPSPTPSPAPPHTIAHVVTSDRGSEDASRATKTTYVVTAAEIARNGYRTVADALAQVPAASVQRYGPFGSVATIGIRGSSESQVLVLLDGLPVAGSQTGNVNLEQLPVAGIDRIEVVEGGGSTLYGSGSIGGVINIISTGAAPQSANVSTGSFGEQSYQLQTPYLAFQRTYASNAFGMPGGTTRTNADAGLTAGTLTYAHSFGGLDAQFLADWQAASLGDPGPIGFLSSTGRQDTIGRDLRLRLEHRSARATLTISMGESSQDLTYACNSPVDTSCPNWIDLPKPGETPPPYAEFVNDQRGMLDLSNATGNDRQRLVYGIDLSGGNDRIDGGTGSACPPTLGQYGYGSCGSLAYESSITPNGYAQTAAYVQAQWFGRNGGELSAGLRGERDLNSLATAQGSALSPSLGAILPLVPGVQLKLNAATAFRAPTAEELFYPPQGIFSNDALVPERTRVGDATIVQRSSWGDASLGWFTTSGSNLIVDQNPAAFDYKPVNIGRASIQGLTFGLHTAPWRHLIATLDVTNLYRAQDLDTNARIEGRGPVFATRLGFRYAAAASSRFGGAGITIASNGAIEPASASTAYYARASGFTTLDAYAAFRVTPKLLFTLRGSNLLDDRYAIYNGYPMPGPGLTVEMRSL